MKKLSLLLLLAVSTLMFTGCQTDKDYEDDEDDDSGGGKEQVDYSKLPSYYTTGNFQWGESKESLKSKLTAKIILEGKDGDDSYVSYETGKLGIRITYFFTKDKLDGIGLDQMDGEYADKLFDVMERVYGKPTQLDEGKYEFIFAGSRIYHEVFGYKMLSVSFEPEAKAIDAYYREPLKSWVATKADVKVFEKKRQLLTETTNSLKFSGSNQETSVNYLFSASGTIERGYVTLPGSLNSKILAALTKDYGKPKYDKITHDYLYTWQRDVIFRISGLDVYYHEYEDYGRYIIVYYSWQDRWVVENQLISGL